MKIKDIDCLTDNTFTAGARNGTLEELDLREKQR